ncbi:hypothetical protein LHJ74_18055 [Streptomyces sp. N2-109]|uniref:Glycosyltransferase n=1 Tax=Streptomyces gossypii TaxID=2883101 RepID=A0ABT2JV52_9ACTN|nr:hypothetical protein [Streptomyces gossypii]MCT2591777.1 hypothetical protein [Streptomyces gossypii]
MTGVRISSAVMTHPLRKAQAEELVARLGLDGLALDPAPQEEASALRTALVAWSAMPEGATHQLVMQDDVAAPPEFPALVARCAARFPDEALVFYTNWHARNGAAVRLAALAGAGWVRAVPEEFTPTLATCLPAALVREFREFARGRVEEERHDDEVLAQFLRRRGRPALLAVPGVVEHIGTSSINGHAAQGVRRVACPVDIADAARLLPEGWVLEDIDWLPYMRYGAGYLREGARQPESDGTRPHVGWQEALPGTGLTEERLRYLAGENRPFTATEVSWLFGAGFANELWTHCLLLGRQAVVASRQAHGLAAGEPAVADLAAAERIAGGRTVDGGIVEDGLSEEERSVARVRSAALSTVGIAGLPPERRPDVRPEHNHLLTAHAWSAVRRGAYPLG